MGGLLLIPPALLVRKFLQEWGIVFQFLLLMLFLWFLVVVG